MFIYLSSNSAFLFVFHLLVLKATRWNVILWANPISSVPVYFISFAWQSNSYKVSKNDKRAKSEISRFKGVSSAIRAIIWKLWQLSCQCIVYGRYHPYREYLIIAYKKRLASKKCYSNTIDSAGVNTVFLESITQT